MKHVFTLTALVTSFLLSNAQISSVAPCNSRPTNGTDFNWTTQNYTIYTISNGLQTVPSPFYNYALNDLNTVELSQYSAKDFLPTDGWVFIKKDFGNSTTATTSHT
jgi:hypothetical protein